MHTETRCVLTPISGEHYKQRPESSKKGRQDLVIIRKREDANITVILKIIRVTISANTKKKQSQNFSFILFQIFTDPCKLGATFLSQVSNYWK